MTDSVNTDHSDGKKMERWRNGNVTHSVNRPLCGYSSCTYLASHIRQQYTNGCQMHFKINSGVH